MTHVFISYVKEDALAVDKLVSELESRGVKVWVDRNDISVGARWADAIRNAIRQGSFFLACFSNQYHNREKTYMNEELTLAIEELRLRPTDRAWFLPVLLDDCEIPDRVIGAGGSLRDIQYASLYPNWNDGLRRILATLDTKAGETAQDRIRENKTVQQLAREAIEKRDLMTLAPNEVWARFGQVSPTELLLRKRPSSPPKFDEYIKQSKRDRVTMLEEVLPESFRSIRFVEHTDALGEHYEFFNELLKRETDPDILRVAKFVHTEITDAIQEITR